VNSINFFLRIPAFLALASLLATHFHTSAFSGQAWMRGMNDPLVVPVRFSATVNSVGTFQASLGGFTGQGNNTNVATCQDSSVSSAYWTLSTPLLETNLVCYKEYDFTMSGGNISRAVGNILPPSITALQKSPRYENAQQYTRYQIFIWVEADKKWVKLCSETAPIWDGINCEDNPTFCINGNFCVPMSKTWKIQVRPDLGARPYKASGDSGISGQDQADGAWSRWDEVDMEAVGDGDKLELQAAKFGVASYINWSWGVSLGRLLNGKSAGKLRMTEMFLGPSIFTPAALNYLSPTWDTNEVEVIAGQGLPARIQQIKAPQAFIWITNLSSTNFEVKYYPPTAIGSKNASGFYTLAAGASNFVTWRIDAPDGTTNKFRIQEIRNAKTNVILLEYTTGPSLWKVTRGIGNESIIESREVAITSTNRVETYQLKNGAGTVSDKAIEVYHKFPWGYELTTVTNDPGGANLVTRFDYFTNPANTWNHRKLAFSSYPDGFWEKRIYADAAVETATSEGVPEGALWRLVHPWKNCATNTPINGCLVTQYNYLAVSLPGGSYQVQKYHDPAAYGEEVNVESGLSACRSSIYEEETILASSAESVGGFWFG